jgi:predicted AAA+ superfamily ATPase
MFKRKIYNDMIAWKESLKVKKKALVIRGARQIGKTTIAIKFAEEFYKNYVYINFKDNHNTINRWKHSGFIVSYINIKGNHILK